MLVYTLIPFQRPGKATGVELERRALTGYSLISSRVKRMLDYWSARIRAVPATTRVPQDPS